jgi:3-hydroxy acid dehydrogenase/malonic semialdehyde reductase
MRTVLVTGASSGFGSAIAERYIADGDRVVALARRADRLKELAERLGPRVHTVVLDVRDSAAVAEAIAGLPGEFAEPDVLVNNAGLAEGLEPAQAADLADWDRMVDTNCKGLTYMTRAVLPGMVQRGRGHVVNLGSVAGTYPYPGGNVYGATKAFVRQLAGGTEFSLVRFHGDAERADAVYDRTQALTATDVAEAVAWATNVPAHVNVNVIELMPVVQSFAGFQVART